MKFIADFHIHSKYSRATSPQSDLEHLEEQAVIKGIDVLGTGDFTHPEWFNNLKEKLEPAEPGLFKLKNSKTRFILTSEISCIYSKNGKVRKIHILVLAPDFKTVEKINTQLGWIGNLKSDGRPILGIDAQELVKIILNISSDCLIIPAHVMTPWFGLFGSKSGFDSLKECFEDYSKYIFAGETGLSADPKMLWRMPDVRKITLISNSDAHCVHPDTNIYTIYGKPKPIKDLNPSKALSINFVGNLKQIDAKISKLHKLSSPPVLCKITTRTKEIITTPEHRFFVLENEEIIERKASELKKNDLVACLRQISSKGKSKKLPLFSIDHEVKILPKGIEYLRALRIKNKKSQKDIGKYIGVSEDCVWIFEKYKVKTPKESFINKYCGYLGVDKNRFKKKFMVYRFPLEKAPKFTNEEFCQILGYVVGDGGIGHSKGKIKNLSLTDKDINLLTHYQKLIKKVFNIEGKVKKEQGNANGFRYPAYLAEYLQKIDSKILVYSPKRQISDFIFGLPKKEIAAFLRGLFDAEGTIADHSIQISSSSLVLIKEVQVLLLKFGINASIYHDFEKNKKKWRYKISIYGHEQLKIFMEEIGFNSVPKKEKLSKYLFSLQQSPKNSFTDPLPLKEEILRVKQALKVSYHDIPGRLYYHLKHNNTLKRGNVKEFLKIFLKYPKINPILEKIKKFVRSDIIWEPIQETKRIKSNCEYVYDLTISNYENYIANGFIVHNSAPHIGREANVFDTELSYPAIIEAIISGDPKKFLYTIEFFPQQGKYYYDGHRKCEISSSPQETKKYNGICPVCGRPLTIGVLSRVEELADKPEGFKPENVIPFKSLVPLKDIIADLLKIGVGTKGVEKEYEDLIQKFGSEFNVLLDTSISDLEQANLPEIAKAISRLRKQEIYVEPGYDGEYGKINIFSKGEARKISGQKNLF